MSGKPIKEKLNSDPSQSILFRRVIRHDRPNIYNEGVWHYHDDFEITFTLKSTGKRFVGYNISDYQENDFVLLAGFLPHCWITNQATEQIVVNFKKEIFGVNFLNNPELFLVRKLLEKSKQGVQFTQDVADKALPILIEMEYEIGLNKFFLFMKLLKLMAEAETHYLLTFHHHKVKDSLIASNRIEKVYSYILQNYQTNSISFTDLCNDLNMTKSSVCKFVKKVTKKSFSEIVLETKINYACKLLIDTETYIGEVCYKSGFNNVSNFNRAFKKIMGKTPKEYRAFYSDLKVS
jgi:AraC-like DNA-binding protein